MRNAFRKAAVIASLSAGLLLSALPAAAQGFSIIPENCIDQGRNSPAPTLDCLVETGVTVARLFFGLSGTFALLMFVIGGFTYITSAGSDEKIKKGKEYIRNAVIGLVIILTGAYGVEYGMNALLGQRSCAGTAYVDETGTPQCCEGGVIVTIATGSAAGAQKCVKSRGAQACGDVAPGYECTDITQRDDQGASCIRGLCPGGDEIRCCPSAGTPAP
jgi:hypothetical protein